MTENYYRPPKAESADLPLAFGRAVYVGVRVRAVAGLIDALVIVLVTWPILVAIYGVGYLESPSMYSLDGPADLVISWVVPAVATVVLWVWKQATPGKMIMRARIVDAETGAPLSPVRASVRYLGFLVSVVALMGLPLLWVAFDARKQGLHDKIAGSVVVTSR